MGRRKNKVEASRDMAKGRTPSCFSCTTFNILAPIYKRLDHQDQSRRESDYKADWINRNHMILDSLLAERSSIICLQEFWVGNEDLVNMYNERLGDAGYVNYKLARTNNRGDGLLTAVHKDYFQVISDKAILLNGFGDRVAQLLHVELLKPLSQRRVNNCRQEMLIVNTHLLFPHDSSLCLERLCQVYKILQYVESYQKENKLNPLPILLCGDWNGSKRGHVYKFLRSLGFVSSYDTAHQYSDADAQKWVSHRNHRGNICGVDFIWLLNPNRYRKAVLKTSWTETVFGIFKDQVLWETLKEADADALRRLNITGNCFGLSMDVRKDLREQADIDGNGPPHYKEFLQRIWNPTLSDQRDKLSNEVWEDNATVHTFGFSVNDAVLFPTEVEKGIWPEDYCLSDHARLTAVFSPIESS